VPTAVPTTLPRSSYTVSRAASRLELASNWTVSVLPPVDGVRNL
jgi:hypothetical protein